MPILQTQVSKFVPENLGLGMFNFKNPKLVQKNFKGLH